MKRILYLIAILILFPVFSLSAIDVGVMSDQTISVNSFGSDSDALKNGFLYSVTLTPWFSMPVNMSSGWNGKFYFSGALTAEYSHDPNKGNKVWSFIPELARTEIMFRSSGGLEINIGRIFYSDPLGFVLSGFFDGARVSLDYGKAGIFGAGVWYTGLLYKTTAEITMTDEDMDRYGLFIDYTDFANTYFAPRRFLAALDWENPEITEWLKAKIALIVQTDLTGNRSRYHSQYLAAKATAFFNNFIFNLGSCVELFQYFPDSNLADANGNPFPDEVKLGIAGELGVGWFLPTRIEDQLTLIFRLSSGNLEEGIIGAFVPITTQYQGDIIEAKLSGLSAIQLDYTGRINKSFAFNLAGTYFILSDLGTYSGYPGEKNGFLLGGEISGRVIWSPVSDLVVYFGGGAFLPSLGNADPQKDALWKLELNVSLMVF